MTMYVQMTILLPRQLLAFVMYVLLNGRCSDPLYVLNMEGK